MEKVGRLVAKRNEINQVEWRRVVSVNPVRYGGPLAITKADSPAPERYPSVDWSIVCKQCDGSGHYPENSTEACPVCGGNGRKKPVLITQKPRVPPSKPFRGWAELLPR